MRLAKPISLMIVLGLAGCLNTGAPVNDVAITEFAPGDVRSHLLQKLALVNSDAFVCQFWFGERAGPLASPITTIAPHYGLEETGQNESKIAQALIENGTGPIDGKGWLTEFGADAQEGTGHVSFGLTYTSAGVLEFNEHKWRDRNASCSKQLPAKSYNLGPADVEVEQSTKFKHETYRPGDLRAIGVFGGEADIPPHGEQYYTFYWYFRENVTDEDFVDMAWVILPEFGYVGEVTKECFLCRASEVGQINALTSIATANRTQFDVRAGVTKLNFVFSATPALEIQVRIEGTEPEDNYEFTMGPQNQGLHEFMIPMADSGDWNITVNATEPVGWRLAWCGYEYALRESQTPNEACRGPNQSAQSSPLGGLGNDPEEFFARGTLPLPHQPPLHWLG